MDATRFERLVTPDEQRRTRREAIGAGAALFALVVGLPALLWALAGPPPIPTSLPGAKELAQQLSFEDVLTVLVGVVWLAWLFFVVCVVLEVVAARRGGLAATVPLGGPVQRIARVLVGTLLLSGILAGPAQAVAGAPDAHVPVPAGIGLSAATMDAEIEVLEAAAEDNLAQAAAETGLSKVYTVKAPHDGYHDNLWDIADRHLGDGFRYKEIYELNKDRVQADGRKLELARLIQPGWELLMPDDAVGVERLASAPVHEAPAAPTDDGAAEETASTDAVGDWAAGSGLLAATVLAAVLLQRRRRIGRRPGDDARALEADLRVAATRERAEWLDLALRGLAARCRQAGVTPPSPHAVLLSDDVVELLLSPGAPEGVDGWSVHDEGRRWRFERTDDDAVVAHEVVPYPALVSIGTDLDGRDVLLDLESAGGIVAIGGDLAVAEQVASSVAVQAATATWSETIEVTASALPAGVSEIGIERLTLVDDLEGELDGLEQHVAGLPDDVLQGRIGRRSPVGSRVVVAGTVPSTGVADRLGALAGGGARALSVVVVGEHPSARWRLRVDNQGNLEVPQLGLTTVANRLGPAQVESLAELFSASREPDPGPDRAGVPAAPRLVDDAAWATAAHRVAVLGRVAVQGTTGDLAVPRIDQSTEIVTYLAMHPEGVHPTVLAGAVWPRGVPQDVLEAAIERAREWLGTDVDGTHLLRADAEGRLSLADAVVCDWHVVCTLLHESRRATQLGTESELLRRALVFVRGEPFDAVPRGRYAWVARDDLPRTMVTVIVDAAERLSRILGGDPDGTAQAAQVGLTAAPGHQPLWRVLLRARHATEGIAGVRRTLAEMSDALRSIPIDAETEALIDELLPPEPQEAHA